MRKSSTRDYRRNSRRKTSFPKNRSEMAIRGVLQQPLGEFAKPNRSRQFHLLVLLDVKNAFNCVIWTAIKDSPANIGISGYLKRLLYDHLSDRKVKCEGITHAVVAGVPQGSILFFSHSRVYSFVETFCIRFYTWFWHKSPRYQDIPTEAEAITIELVSGLPPS